MIYFDHDVSASSDDRIMSLRIACGGSAVDAYWSILELMYRDELTELNVDSEDPSIIALVFRLVTTYDQLVQYIEAMVRVGLLTVVDEAQGYVVTSLRVQQSIEKYQKRCKTNAENGRKSRKTKAQDKKTKQIASDLEASDNPVANESLTTGTPDGGISRSRSRSRSKDNINTSFYKDVVDYLNEKTHSSYKYTTSNTQTLINARVNDGFTLQDFHRVIDNMTREWLHDQKYKVYLRPQTLFGTKFESYLNRGGNIEYDEFAEYDI